MRDLADELLQAKVKTRLFGGDHAPRLGRLVLLDRIGSGAMGTVFSAYDPRLDREVAVKVLHASGDVEQEARALAKLAHPNVVAVHDVDERDGAVVMVMELVVGVPLRAWIGGGRPWRDVVRVMREAGAGLAAAHRAGLVHRDIKPDNIIIGDDRVRVVDFGIAHDLARDDDSRGAGTPLYMAPEVLAGGDATAASDQFSLGVTFHEALYGERPYVGTTRAELIEAAKAPSAGKPGAPAWLRAVVARAMAAEPVARFASLGELVGELERDRRRKLVAVVAPMALVAAGLGAFALVRGSSNAELCGGGAERRARSWSAGDAAALHAKLGDAGWAATAIAALDATAAAWETSSRRVCEATRVRGEQSDALLELRMRCLDRALARFDALVVASRGCAGDCFQVATAIAELPQPAACEDVSDPHELALPADPARRSRALAAEADLDHAWAAYVLGRYPDARAQVTAIDARTADLDAPALRAQLLVLAGSVDARTGTAATARASLYRALEAAARADIATLELDVWARILRQELFAGDPAHVVEWAGFAHAAAARAGRDGAELDGIVGQALREAGQLQPARDRLTKALASADPLRGDQRALLEMNLGSVELAAGDPNAAAPLFERALADARTALGDGHPSLAIHLDKLAAADRARGRIRDALARHDQSLALRTAVFTSDDRAIATSLYYRAETLLEAGRLDDARRDLERARHIREASYGATSPRLGEVDAALGDVAAAGGHLDDARALYDHAASLDPRLRLEARRAAVGLDVALDKLPLTIEPLSAERVAAIGVRFARGDRALAPVLAARWRTLRRPAPGLSLAVADALAAAADRAGAIASYTAGLDAIGVEPTRTRMRLLAGLAKLDPAFADAARAAAAALDRS